MSEAKEAETTVVQETTSGSEIKQRREAGPGSAANDAKQQDVRASVDAKKPSSAGKQVKPKWQLPVSASHLGIAATCVLGGLGLALHFYAGPRSRVHLPVAEPIPMSEGDIMPEGELPHESLEDALKSLEGAEPVAAAPVDIEGDFFHGLADHIDVREAHQPKDEPERRQAKPKKSKRTVAPPAQAEQAVAEGETEEDALKKLEGRDETKGTKDIVHDLLQKMSSSDSKTADEVVEKASKKSKKSKSGKKPKLSDEEKEQAKTLLQDTLKKMQSGDGDHTEELERLKALLGKDGEDDDAQEGKTKKKNNKKGQKDEEEEGAHGEFVKLLSGEKEREQAHTLDDVKKEFKQEFAADSKYLLCAGCKLVSARLTSELSTHDVHESDSPAQMIAAKRKAIDATCGSFRHLQVASSSTGLRIQAGEANPDGPGKPDAPSRLCHALLEESKFDILTKLIQAKIPEHSYLGGASAKGGQNWERWLCAQRARVCKRSEVREDDEEQEL